MRDNIIWERCGEGIRVLKIYSNSSAICVPSIIEGLPVTEIGAYCFSASEPRLPKEYGETDPGADLPAACGKGIRSVELPEEVRVLHNAAFYNCRALEELSFGRQISSIGSDEFTNCTGLSSLVIRCGPVEASGLPRILERLEGSLEVTFRPEGSRKPAGKLFFPEYYEWLDEISPAHIFSRSIHGEGFRMRKCFQDHVPDYEKYDRCFARALSTESDANLCAIALDRLRWPVRLADSAKTLYKEAARQRIEIILQDTMKQKDLEKLIFVSGCFALTQAERQAALALCYEGEWAEGAAYLMDQLHRHSAPKQFVF